MNITALLPYLTIIGFILMFLGYLFTQFLFGGKGVAKEVIDTYKTQVDQLRAELETEKSQRAAERHDLRNEITALGLKLANIQGQLTEKDKKLEEFTQIFQGKSPELIQILSEIRDFMEKLSTQSTTNQDRNIKIDKTTKAEEGKIMRNK